MEIVFNLLIGISLVLVVAWCVRRCLSTLHLLQLDSYNNKRLMKWLKALPAKRLFDIRLGLFSLGLLALDLILWFAGIRYGPIFVLGVWSVGSAAFFFGQRPVPAKKPLVFTGRAKRILAVSIAMCLILTGLLGLSSIYVNRITPTDDSLFLASVLVIVFGGIFIQVAWAFVILANTILKPVQTKINDSYINKARERLRQINPIVIGVAGSYGKTSTKFILETILSERFRVLKTPQSYNNILGITRVINSDLRPEHEVFIVELGGYKRGDIKRSTDLVHPTISVIAAIGPEHLERLKTMENVEAMNYEAIEALPESGVAVFNNDMERSRALADKTKHIKVLRYGLDQSQPNLFLSAEDIKFGSDGLTFTIVDAKGNRISVGTCLLGRHNVLNILGAASVALEVGLTLEEIARAIRKLSPVPHRLQLIQGHGGVTVIDDAYNSNPIGAMEALNVLKEFNGGKRLMITPGMVELGDLESAENEEFGAKAAKVCDYVFLVGMKRTQDILRGLTREQFPKDKIKIVEDLDEATRELQHIVRPGDVVLFENDLPDLYSEA